MRIASALNLGSTPGMNSTPGVEDEFAQTRQALEQAREESHRTRMQLRQQSEQHEAHVRRTRVLSIILGSLIVCLAASVWYAYPMLKEQKHARVELGGLENATTTLGDRLALTEASLRNVGMGLPNLSSRMDQLQAGMKTGLQSAQTAAMQVGQRLQQDMNRGFALVQSRMAGLESNQKESAEHVVQLEQQIAGLKREIATMQTESATTAEKIKQLGDVQQTSHAELTGLTERIVASQSALTANQAALNKLTTRVERTPNEFKVTNGRTQQIAPGVSLTVKRADVGRQEIDGTLQLAPNGTSLALRAQGIQKPTVFYMQGESRPLELVLTQVSKTDVSGYVLLPTPAAEATAH